MRSESRQSLTNKQAEVAFRRKLAAQQLNQGPVFFKEAHTKEEILAVLNERISQTRNDMRALSGRDVQLTSFIELGAERVQRALLLENEFGAKGFALDISFEMLRSAPIVARHFGYTKMPMRIACDAYNLPFQDSVIDFAFCYQTLHHFPSPRPVLAEIRRLQKGGGTLFLDDEPVAGHLKKLTRMYHRRGPRLRTLESLLDRVGLLTLLSKADDLEMEQNILEEEFDIPTWRDALSEFRPVEIIVNRRLPISLTTLDRGPATLFARLIGGNIRAVCEVEKPGQPGQSSQDRLDLLGCPNCRSRPKLSPLPGSGLQCTRCRTVYPEIDGVLLLFERSLGNRLYPEYLPG